MHTRILTSKYILLLPSYSTKEEINIQERGFNEYNWPQKWQF